MKTKDLQEYALYLRDALEANGAKQGAIHRQLTQFSKENRIKGIMFPNTKQGYKLSALGWYKKEIEHYLKQQTGKEVVLKTFKQYIDP